MVSPTDSSSDRARLSLSAISSAAPLSGRRPSIIGGRSRSRPKRPSRFAAVGTNSMPSGRAAIVANLADASAWGRVPISSRSGWFPKGTANWTWAGRLCEIAVERGGRPVRPGGSGDNHSRGHGHQQGDQDGAPTTAATPPARYQTALHGHGVTGWDGRQGAAPRPRVVLALQAEPSRLLGPLDPTYVSRSLFSGTNWLAMNVAPCGSLITAILVHGRSTGGATISPPSCAPSPRRCRHRRRR